ncbi:MAG: glycosyltransferase family A protein [Acidimicrobiales bacterium]|nr:glycosyltransferase family A protein [Acidimicrobiales bacterium]
MTGPRVSVIVPVRNRRRLLASLMDALAQQSFRDFEVVVVDDGSTDGSDVAAEEERRLPVRVLRADGQGAVAARAVGVAAAQGDVLAFTDSDCVPSPDWLKVGVAAIDKGADVVMGRTTTAAPRRLLERSLSAEDNGLYPTCNVFYRRAAFAHAGGFDPDVAHRLGFRPGARAKGLGFGEDTVLAWRVRRNGRAAYAPGAVVTHAVFPPDLRDHFSRTAQAGAFPALVREVPELRLVFLAGRVFLGSPSRVPLYAALAMCVARSWASVVAMVVLWVLQHAWRVLRRDDPVKRKVLAFPIVLATDALTAAALLVGSVRARTLVL